jgi:serine/threonine protein kinase
LSLIDQTVGNYKVTKLLGEGGMGVVYLAEHPVIGRKVAIKVLLISLSKDAEIVARFFNEARAIHMIGHENIVEILDFGQTADGQPYFIMEYLTGESLAERCARGPIPAAETVDIAEQICNALAAAHEKGIVHRDLKPHNVQLLAGSGGRTLVKILDFGVAKIMTSLDPSHSVKTRTGSLMGTPLYMSPEQCKGSGKLDHRTDIYSLGVMIYEMLAGRPPFVAEGVGELFAMHMLEEPPPVTQFVPATPRHVAAAVMRSLAKNVEDRFASMDDFRRALLGDTVPAAAPSRNRTSARPVAGAPRAGQATIAPAQPTTLSSATSEVGDDELFLPPKRSKVGFVVLGAAAAALAVGFVTYSKRPQPESPPAAVVPASAAETPPAPAEPATVTIRFEVDPSGSHIFRKSDGKDLGHPPLDLQLPRDGGKPEYVVRLEGYKDKVVTADLSRDQTMHISLEKEPVAVPDKVKDSDNKERERKSSRRASSRRSGRSVTPDEDGLATPSF